MALSYINLQNAFNNKKFTTEMNVEVNDEFLEKYGLTNVHSALYQVVVLNYDLFKRKMTDIESMENISHNLSKVPLFKIGENTRSDLYWKVRENKEMENKFWTRANRINRSNYSYGVGGETLEEYKEKDIKMEDVLLYFENMVIHYGYEYEQVIEEDSLEIIQYLLLMQHGDKKNIFKKFKRQSVKINADFNNLQVEKFSFSGSGARKNIVRSEQGDEIFFDTRPTNDCNGYSTLSGSAIPFNVDELIANGNKIWQKLGHYLKKNPNISDDGILNVANPFIIIREYKDKETIISQLDAIPEGSLYDDHHLKINIKRIFNKDVHKSIRDVFGFTRKMEETLSSNTEKYLGYNIGDSNYSGAIMQFGGKIKVMREEFGDVSHDEIFNDENYESFKEYAEEITTIQQQLRRFYYHQRVDTSFMGYLEIYKFARKNRISFIDYINYLKGLIWGEGIVSLNDAQTLLQDYWRMAHVLNMNVKRFPENLKAEHDKINIRHSFLVATQTDKVLNNQYSDFNEYSYKDYIMTFPHSSGDLISEGAELGHCVGSYVTKVATGQTRIFFLRKKEEPTKAYCTIELRDNQITQMKLKSNRPLNDEKALEFVEKWADKYNAKVVGR